MNAPITQTTKRTRARATLGTCGVAHFLHDGFSDTIFVLLPLWTQEFGLSLTQAGLLRSVFSGALSSFQLPIGFLAERWGERVLLVAGTAVTGLAFAFLGLAGGFLTLIALLLLGGLGAGSQHPLSSSMVATAYADGHRRAALGTYNFTGDLGKVAMPMLVALGATTIGWRSSTLGLGLLGVAGAVAIFFALRHLGAGDAPDAAPAQTATREPVTGWGIRNRRGFGILSGIGVIDNSSRSAFLTLLPFLLMAKGAPVEKVGFALALVLAGGAAGKFLCGLLAERFGIVRTVVTTELLTGLGILAVLALPLSAVLVLLAPLGVALNGTSSVLYGTINDFVAPERQARAFGLFYTVSVGASAVSPFVYGALSDLTAVATAMTVIALTVFLTVPLAWLLTPSLAVAGAGRG